MTTVNAYLHFNGNCREAMTFYRDCFEGTLFLQTIGDSPIADQTPPEKYHHILHAALTRGNLIIMGSDMPGTLDITTGNTISLCLNCGSEDELKKRFNALSEGGEIVFPLQDQLWGSTYGELNDRFGINWMLNYDQKTGKPNSGNPI
jgi:PhnB protein